MKLGVFTVPYGNLPLAGALDRLGGLGVEAVELGTGNYPGAAHCDPDALLGDADAAVYEAKAGGRDRVELFTRRAPR